MPARVADTASASDSAGTQPWFAGARRVDLDGDGLTELARLEATGPSVDSLKISFTILKDGRTVYTDSWDSAYELAALTDIGDHPLSNPDSSLTARLRDFLQRLSPLLRDRSEFSEPWSERTDDCTGDARNCIALALLADSTRTAAWRTGQLPVSLFDTAAVAKVVADLLSHRTYQVSYAYGYESSVTIAWSAYLGKFVVLHSCC
jgi:hypothetical protein